MRKLKSVILSLALIATAMCFGFNSISRTEEVFANANNAIIYKNFTTQSSSFTTYSSLVNNSPMYSSDNDSMSKLWSLSLTRPDGDATTSTITGNYSFNNGQSIYVYGSATSSWYKNNPRATSSFRLSNNLYTAAQNGYLLVNMTAQIKTDNDSSYLAMQTGTINTSDMNYLSNIKNTFVCDTSATDGNWKTASLTIGQDKGVSGYTGTSKAITASDIMVVFYNEFVSGVGDNNRLYINNPTLSITSSDTTAPVVAWELSETGWSSNDKILRIYASDNQSGLYSVKVNGQDAVYTTDSNGTYYAYTVTDNINYAIEVVDNVGNTFDGLVQKNDVKIDKVDVSRLIIDVPSSSHTKSITLNVSYTPDGLSPEYVYYTLDGSMPNTSSPQLTLGSNTLDFSSLGNKTYILTAILVDEVGHQSKEVDIIRETFRIDDTRYKINVNAEHGTYEVVGGSIEAGETEPHAWYGDIIGIKYLPNDGYELYKLYRNGREEVSEDAYYVYQCHGDTTLDIKFRYRVNMLSYDNEYQFEEGKILSPSYTLNTQDEIELSLVTKKDGQLSSLSNSGDYVVEWSIDNENYIGSGVMNIKITPIQVVINYGDNSYFEYSGEIQSINYEITESFDYELKYYLNDIESDFLNAGTYIVKFISSNSNYEITNDQLTVEISKCQVGVTINSNSFEYTSEILALDYSLAKDVESVVVYTQNDVPCEFKNSGEYSFEVKPIDENNYIFTNSTGNCSISKVDVYFVVEKTSYHYTANTQSIIYSMVNGDNETITFVNGLTINYVMNGSVVDFKEPGSYSYTFATEDDNYNLYDENGSCEIIIVNVNIVINKLQYEYTGNEIAIDYSFKDDNGEIVLFENISYRVKQNGEEVGFIAVGVYAFEFFTDDVYYNLVNSNGEIEIIVANVEVSVGATTFKYSEDGIIFDFSAISQFGTEYKDNSLITLNIFKDNVESSLTNVGTYLYTITSSDNSIILSGDVEGSIIIEQKEIIASVTPTYVYSGNTITFEYSLSQEIPVSVTIQDNIIDVNTYDYSIVSADSNYIVINGSGKINVLPLPVNVNIQNYDYTYNGNVQTIHYDLTINIDNTLTILMGGEETEFKNAGEYTLLFTSLNKNYVIETTNIFLEIKQKQVDISVDNLTQTYGKDEKSVNVIVQDNVSYKVNFESTPINVATYPFEVVITNPNYKGSYKGNLVIEKKVIDITPIAGQYKIYGSEDTLLQGSVKGICEGDSVEYTLKRLSGESVGVYEIKLDTFVSDNYSVNYIPDFYSINRRQIILKADCQTKIYGEDDDVFTYDILSGEIVDGDDLAVSLYREVGENVGDYKIYLNDNYNDNYKILFSASSVLSILPKDLNVTINNIETIYSQEKELTYTVHGDYDENQIVGEIVREFGFDVGSYAITQGTLDSTNYNLIVTDGVYRIVPRELYVSAIATTKIYGEEDNLTYTVTNLCEGDVLVGELSRIQGENVGTYNINLGTISNPNYNINFTSATLTILKAELNIVIDNKEQIYGEESQPLTYSISGLKFDDKLQLELFRNGGDSVGEYYISCYMNVMENYYIGSMVSGVYTIKKGNIVPILQPEIFTYNGEGVTLETDFPYELNYEYSLNGAVVDSMVNVGTYSVVAVFEGNENYNPSVSAPVRVTIKKCPVNFVLAENNYIADGNVKFPEYYFDSACGLSVDNVIYTYETDVLPIEAGSYNFNISVIDPNYEGSVDGVLTIADSLVIESGDAVIECAEATFDAKSQSINMVKTNNSVKISDKKVLSSFVFENFNNEEDYIYTIRIKSNGLKSISLYQMVDGKLVEVDVNKDGDDFVFRSNNLNGEFYVAKDKLDNSIVMTIILGGCIVTLGGLYLTLRVIKARRLKRSKVSDIEVDNYNIG